jgi:hypothetical protein
MEKVEKIMSFDKAVEAAIRSAGARRLRQPERQRQAD